MNLDKSEMVSVGVVSNILSLASILDCKVSSFPMKYLGLPLSATFKSRAIWDRVVEKIEKRLAGWKKGVSFERGSSHSYQEYPYKSFHLFFIPFSYACRGGE